MKWVKWKWNQIYYAYLYNPVSNSTFSPCRSWYQFNIYFTLSCFVHIVHIESWIRFLCIEIPCTIIDRISDTVRTRMTVNVFLLSSSIFPGISCQNQISSTFLISFCSFISFSCFFFHAMGLFLGPAIHGWSHTAEHDSRDCVQLESCQAAASDSSRTHPFMN